MAGVTDSKEVEILIMFKHTSALSTGLDYCTNLAPVDKPNTRFNVDRNRVFIQAFPLNGAYKKFVGAYPRAFFYNSDSIPFLAGLLGDCRMYDFMTKTYYWPHVVKEVYDTVQESRFCAKHCEHC